MKTNWRDSIRSFHQDVVATDSLLPVNTGTRSQIMFRVPALPDQLLDLKATRLHFKFMAKKEVDGIWVDLEDEDEVAVYNNFGMSIFDDIHLLINGTLVETAQREYGRSSYIRNLLYHSGEKELESSWFFEDSPGQMDMVVADMALNLGKLLVMCKYICKIKNYVQVKAPVGRKSRTAK